MGTGIAGVLGYTLSMFLVPLLTPFSSIIVAALLVTSYWSTFVCVLETPWVDALRAGHGASNTAAAKKGLLEAPGHRGLRLRGTTGGSSASATGESTAAACDAIDLQAQCQLMAH